MLVQPGVAINNALSQVVHGRGSTIEGVYIVYSQHVDYIAS